MNDDARVPRTPADTEEVRVPRTEAAVWSMTGKPEWLCGRLVLHLRSPAIPANHDVVLTDARDDADTRELMRVAATMLDQMTNVVEDEYGTTDLVVTASALASRLRAVAGPA